MQRRFQIITAVIFISLVSLVATSVDARGKLPGVRTLMPPWR